MTDIPPNSKITFILAPQTSGFTDIINQPEVMSDCNLNAEAQIATVLILDEKTFTPKWTYFLEKNELGTSILSAQMGSDGEQYLVIGTAVVLPDEHESKKGRVIILRWTSSGKVHFSNVWSFILNVFLVGGSCCKTRQRSCPFIGCPGRGQEIKSCCSHKQPNTSI